MRTPSTEARVRRNLVPRLDRAWSRSTIATMLPCLAAALSACAVEPEPAEPASEPAVGVAKQAAQVPLNVDVVNDETNPVPTKSTGTTSVAGTVSATQSGNWNVGISGTPTVGAQQSGSWDVNVAGDVSL